MTPIVTGYIQLYPSTAQAIHNWPLNLPVRNVLSLQDMAYNLEGNHQHKLSKKKIAY
jgi:hypothetical protein